MTFHDLDGMDVEIRRELLTAYLDGELSTEQALTVSRWLDGNPGALREVEHLRHLWDLLENYEDEPVPEDFALGVVKAVGLERDGAGRPAGRVLELAWYRRPLATAAAILVAVGATALLMSPRSAEVPSAEDTVVSLSRLEALGVEDLESLEFLDVIADADDDTFDALVADGLTGESQTADLGNGQGG